MRKPNWYLVRAGSLEQEKFKTLKAALSAQGDDFTNHGHAFGACKQPLSDDHLESIRERERRAA